MSSDVIAKRSLFRLQPPLMFVSPFPFSAPKLPIISSRTPWCPRAPPDPETEAAPPHGRPHPHSVQSPGSHSVARYSDQGGDGAAPLTSARQGDVGEAPLTSPRQGDVSLMSLRNFDTSLLNESSTASGVPDWHPRHVVKKLSEAPFALVSDPFQVI